MSALPPITDITRRERKVRFVSNPDIAPVAQNDGRACRREQGTYRTDQGCSANIIPDGVFGGDKVRFWIQTVAINPVIPRSIRTLITFIGSFLNPPCSSILARPSRSKSRCVSAPANFHRRIVDESVTYMDIIPPGRSTRRASRRTRWGSLQKYATFTARILSIDWLGRGSFSKRPWYRWTRPESTPSRFLDRDCASIESDWSTA